MKKLSRAVIKKRQAFVDTIKKECADPKKKKHDFSFYIENVEYGQYVLNTSGNILMKFVEPIVETLPENSNCEHFNAMTTMERCKCDSCFSNACKLELPEIKELKTYIKNVKFLVRHHRISNSHLIYKFGNNLPAVKAELLVQIMEMNPDLMLYYNGNNPTMTPLYGINGHEDVIIDEVLLMPVKVPKGAKMERTDLHMFDEEAARIRESMKNKAN